MSDKIAKKSCMATGLGSDWHTIVEETVYKHGRGGSRMHVNKMVPHAVVT